MNTVSLNMMMDAVKAEVNPKELEKYVLAFKQLLTKHPERKDRIKDVLTSLISECYDESESTLEKLSPISIDLPALYDLNSICKLLKIRIGSNEYKNLKSKITYDRNHNHLNYEKTEGQKKYLYSLKDLKNYFLIHNLDYYNLLKSCEIDES
jgi:uncharacterized membrane protein YukC